MNQQSHVQACYAPVGRSPRVVDRMPRFHPLSQCFLDFTAGSSSPPFLSFLWGVHLHGIGVRRCGVGVLRTTSAGRAFSSGVF